MDTGGGVEVLVKEAFESLVSNRPLAFMGLAEISS